MEMLDASIVTTAIPTISKHFQASTSIVSMTITAYITAVAVFISISGWLVGKYNVKKIFLSAIALLTLASFGCALAPALPVLIFMRILQGIGGAMMYPVGSLIVLQQTSKKDLLVIISFLV